MRTTVRRTGSVVAAAALILALAAGAADFADRADADGKTVERFEIIYLIGWAPSPDQPRPARRGSATASLAAVLERRD